VIKKALRQSERVDPTELDKQTDAVEAVLKNEGPRMNAIAAYLTARNGKNGFGSDFEFTLRPKESY
jgi:hypothetical protein